MDNNNHAIAELFETGAVRIPITYESLGQTTPFVFYLRPLLSREAKSLRQVFFGLSEDEQESRKAEFNAKLLGLLSVKPPENIPAFENNGNLQEAVYSYFNSDNLMRQKLAEDAINLWITMTQPKEFFRII